MTDDKGKVMCEVPETFTAENGYQLQMVHLQKEGLVVRLSHPLECEAAIKLTQDDIIRLKKWFNKYYGLFF